MYASFGQGMAKVSTGYEAGLFGMEGRGMYVGGNVGVKGASLYAQYAQNGGWDWGVGGAMKTDLWNYDSNEGFDYVGKEFVDALSADDDIKYPEKGIDLQKKGKWGNTNYCGAGGGGGLTDGVDRGCFAHDRRYEGENASGIVGAFLGFNPRIVAADLKLVWNSFTNIHTNPLAGIEVGTVFTIISTYKVPVMLMLDLIRKTNITIEYHGDYR